MKSQRSAFLGLALGLAVLGMSACEDKTDIIIPEPPVPDVTVSLVPDAAELQVGQTLQLVAVVTGGATGTARTVTYASSLPTVATVNATGLVTAVAAGITTITATATADTNAKDASVITVGGGAAPTISIKSITTFATTTPVNINNTFGQIDITLNLDIPEGTRISRVETLVDGNVVCTQTFTTTGADVGLSADELNALQEIICSVNTAAFNATTGAVTFANGPHTITARVIGPQGTVAASTSTNLVFNNTNFLSATLSSSRSSATSGSGPRSVATPGLLWHAGDITVTMLPVVFNGSTNAIASATVTLTTSGNGVNGNAGCQPTSDATVDPTISSTDGGAGAANLPSCAPASATKTVAATAGQATLAATFPQASTMSAGGVSGVEDAMTIAINSVTTAGQAGPVCINPNPVTNPQGPACVGTSNLAFPNGLRVDNLAPRVTQLNVVRPSQYYNGTFVPLHTAPGGVAACTAPCARTVDYGVDRQTDTGNAIFNAGASSTALTDVTAGFSSLVETATANTNLFQLVVKDALANSRTVYATAVTTTTSTTTTGALLFGIDNTLPTLTITAGPATLTNNNTTNTGVGVWTITFSDAGVGPSGFNVNPIMAKLERFAASQTTNPVCLDPTSGAVISCTNAAAGFVANNGTVNVPAPDGYYRLTINVTDAAGNQTTNTMVLTLNDITAPTAGGVATPAILTGGASAAFSSALADNVDLGDFLASIGFGGTFIAQPRQTIGSYDPLNLKGTDPGAFTVAKFIRSVEGTTGAGRPDATVVQANVVQYAARDVAGMQTQDPCPAAGAGDGAATQNCFQRQADITAAVAAGSPGGFPSFTTSNVVFASGNAAHGNFIQGAPSAATVCNKTTGTCASATTAPLSTTLTATVTGPNATFQNPFDRVNFYYQAPSGRWILIGTGTVSLTDDTVLATRTFTYTVTWTPTGLLPAGAAPGTAYAVRAVGIDTNGSALMATSSDQVVNIISS